MIELAVTEYPVETLEKETRHALLALEKDIKILAKKLKDSDAYLGYSYSKKGKPAVTLYCSAPTDDAKKIDSITNTIKETVNKKYSGLTLDAVTRGKKLTLAFTANDKVKSKNKNTLNWTSLVSMIKDIH